MPFDMPSKLFGHQASIHVTIHLFDVSNIYRLVLFPSLE